MLFQNVRSKLSDIVIISVLLLSLTPLVGNAHETEFPGEKLAKIFPKAKKFVQRNAVLTPEKVKSIEIELGSELRKEDKNPVFYIPISDQKKPMGLVLFVDVKGPHGTIDGAVGLDMKGKVVKVEIYEHKESEAITAEKFLKQFIGKGIDDDLEVGKDIEAIKEHEEATEAVILLPRKTLLMSYALFLKRKPKTDVEEKPDPEEQPEELPEVEDIKELMILMVDEYFVIVDYFDEKEEKADAVASAEKLAIYAKAISQFEPPKNADQIEEYVEMQDRFSKTLKEFAEAIETNGITDDTRRQWEEIDALIKQAHIRFSEEDIDLEAY